MYGKTNKMYPQNTWSGWFTYPNQKVPDEEMKFSYRFSGSSYYLKKPDDSWILQLNSTGDLSIDSTSTQDGELVDIFMVGSGCYPVAATNTGGGGGSGIIIRGYRLEQKDYDIVVGTCENKKSVVDTKFDEIVAAGATAKTGAKVDRTQSIAGVEKDQITFFDGKSGGDGAAGGNSTQYAFDENDFKMLISNGEEDSKVYTFGAGGGSAGTDANRQGWNGGTTSGGKGGGYNSSTKPKSGKDGTGSGGGGGEYYNSTRGYRAQGGSGIIIIRSHKEPATAQVVSRAADALATSDLEALWQRINELETELTALKGSNTTPEESNLTETNQEDNLND